jgi:hypothetical protein
VAEEHRRLEEARTKAVPWRRWGPYLSERQWGTVREDYSENGDAWHSFPHAEARSRAYRWGEDGLAGISDDRQRLCFALALWNGHDPILKERLFGLTNSEGNHGEDVKEYYFYLDSTPTHSYMKYLYKYPQAAFPYEDLVQTNRQRSRHELEYELLDTGIFADDRYFDVAVEYAKAGPNDILIAITAHNRGDAPAELHLLPTLWFRDTWWMGDPRPSLRQADVGGKRSVVEARHEAIGAWYLICQDDVPLLFTENETNHERLSGQPNRTPYVKDGIGEYVVGGRVGAVNPDHHGTKVSAHHRLTIEGGRSTTIRLRLNDLGLPLDVHRLLGDDFETVLCQRRAEADEFYAAITPASASEDEARVMRQGLAGMLWSKQYYEYDLDLWLEERDGHPMRSNQGRIVRNRHWFHMNVADVISMPDTWEYPWFAAWDLAFHTLPLSLVDPDLAKEQLGLMLSDQYLHPSGQLPAYEWNFSDVNPPVHAWAASAVYFVDRLHHGTGDVEFLRLMFRRLLMNFSWWVNRKDPRDNNVFQGGFLGLDNIGVFDRSAPLPTGGHLEQADGTAWMALFCQSMLEIAVELAVHDPSYDDVAEKFLEHFLWIAGAIDRVGQNDDEMWDEEDGFFYDVLRLPDGSARRLKVRSMVGLLPLCASTVFAPDVFERLPRLQARSARFIHRHPELVANITTPDRPGARGRYLLSLLNERKLRRVLAIMLDESEFLSPYGIRSLSRYHLDHPFVLNSDGYEYRVGYLPAESDSGMFGGNSNWRGPIWMPVNLMLLRALMNLHTYYGDDFKIECPTGSGTWMTLASIAHEIAGRLISIFVRGEDGRRPVYGGSTTFQEDPHWRDLVLFYEYFHGDNGAGIGASHQTGWTGLIARVIEQQHLLLPDRAIEIGPRANQLATDLGEWLKSKLGIS